VHANNAHFQTATVTLDLMERSAMKKTPHPPYIPNLASLDFCLCGHVKQLLRGYEFANQETLLHAIEATLGSVEKLILEAFFSAGSRNSANVVVPLDM
jgi:hypothetical protein